MQSNMYSSRGGNAYGQQSYSGQSAYGQNLGSTYSGSNVGGPEGSSQLSMASRHSAMLGASSEADVGPYRGHPSATAHYSGQYSSVYGTSTLSSVSQVSAAAAKAGSSTLEGRGGYGSAISDSPKFSSSEYVPTSSHGYGNKSSQLYGEKVPDYSGLDRRQYGERQSSYMGRDMQTDPTGRYADSVSFAHQHQNEIYDRIDQAVLIRQEQLLKSQSLQSSSLDGNTRDTDYLAARSAASRHPTQDLISIGGRIDSDSRGMSMLSASSYNAPSILGAAPRRNVDDLIYTPSSSNPNYGISLPPGREYAPGKAMHIPSLDPEYPIGVLPRGGHSRLDERKDDRASYLREFELREEERRQERLRDRERDREKEKEREREREREKERERTRERLRVRDRERERIFDRREERDRERKRGLLEIRRERSPLRLSRDRRGSSLLKDGRLNRRDSPQRELLHRRRSPVKEKRREYVCKVYSSSLVDVERDYLSLDKRYPRLFISPEFSKAVVYWPKENLKLSIHTPVSFVHDFVEEESATGQVKGSDNLAEPVISGHRSTIWNAKVILMSGISKNSLEELSSERNSDDRIPHIYNILRFAVSRKDHSFQAIGGPWDSVDGGDPSVDDTSLIHTAQRHVREIAQLDLQNCRNWNRFLEIHYDRVGKDGLFSHKEVTVLFVPDLSECLPSLDLWRSQWLAHQKAVAEQERRLVLRRERMKEKEALKEKGDSSKDVKRVDKEEKKKDTTSSGKAKDEKDDKSEKISKDVKGNEANDKSEKKDPTGSAEEVMEVDNKEGESTPEAQTPSGSGVKGKKKIIRKLVIQKVVAKKTGDTSAKDENEKEKEEKSGNLESSDKPDPSSATKSGVKTFVRKKPGNVGKPDPDEGKEDIQIKKKVEKEVDVSGNEPNDKSNSNSGAVSKETPVGKTMVKKKIIKRVPKRKIASVQSTDENPEVKREVDSDEKNVEAGNGRQSTGKQNADAETKPTDGKKSEKKTQVNEKKDNNENSSKIDLKNEKVVKKEVKGSGEKSDSGGAKEESQTDKKKVSQKDTDDAKKGQLGDEEKSKDEKEKKGKDSNEKEKKGKDASDESRSKSSSKEVKDKKKVEEPPRHPGFVLQTKWSRDSRMRSPSLALETLLDYSDKDVEESTFEISLFAETLCEMFQYQMGCRLLTFLQKLRLRFVRKRSQQKRRREEKSENEKEKDKMSPTKRLKTDDAHVLKSESIEAPETVMNEDNTLVDKKDDSNKAEERNLVDEAKTENDEEEEEEDPEEDPEEEDPEEDPEEEDPEEEDPEEDEEMDEANPQEDVSVQNDKAESEKEKIEKVQLVKELANEKSAELNRKSDPNTVEKVEAKPDVVKKVTIDKDLLQAFRFFDRNQAGYVRVEDLRSIIHNLGKFLSHRDVKELVQSALLESNTGRDDQILYNKLVRMELQ